MTGHAALVIAGGLSRRMGADKATLLLDGRPLLWHAVRACAGSRAVVVVGPARFAALVEGFDAHFAREDPPGGGPAAGIAAGVAALGEDTETVQLLPCDLVDPAGLVRRLDETAWSEAQALVPVDEQGWPQFLYGRYRLAVLRDAVAGPVRDVSVRRLLRDLPRREVEVPTGLLRDVDDPGQAAEAGITLP